MILYVICASFNLRSSAGQCEVCGEQNGTSKSVSPEYFSILLSVLLFQCCIFLFVLTQAFLKDKGPAAENVQTVEYSCGYRKKCTLTFMFIYNFSSKFCFLVLNVDFIHAFLSKSNTK
jgi:hypothetical protein